MNSEILGSSPSLRERKLREPAPPSSPAARHWRMSIVLSLGIMGLLASFVIAAISLRSRADHSSTSSISATTPADEKRWYSLGYVDIEGGVTPLYPLQPGRVKSIEARENELIKAGDPLFRLEDTVQSIKLREAECDLEGAQKQLAIAEAGVEEARKQIAAQKIAIEAARKKVELACLLRDKQKAFFNKGLSGDKETVQAAEVGVEQAELGVKGEEAKLAVIEAKLREAEGYVAAAEVKVKAKQAQLEEAQNAVNECVVRAPVDGTPLRILVTVGQPLGSNPRQPAIQFAADRPLLVRAEVEQEFVGRVRPGQGVDIEDHVTGQKCADGKVASLARWYAPHRTVTPEISPFNSDTRTLECIVRIESKLQEIRIGQRVRVRFPE